MIQQFWRYWQRRLLERRVVAVRPVVRTADHQSAAPPGYARPHPVGYADVLCPECETRGVALIGGGDSVVRPTRSVCRHCGREESC